MQLLLLKLHLCLLNLIFTLFPWIQSDAKAGFLRAARDGHLDKVLEHLKNNTDINTSNAVNKFRSSFLLFLSFLLYSCNVDACNAMERINSETNLFRAERSSWGTVLHDLGNVVVVPSCWLYCRWEKEKGLDRRFSPFTAKPTKRTDIAATFPATQLGFLPAKVEGGFAHVIHFFFVLVFVGFFPFRQRWQFI